MANNHTLTESTFDAPCVKAAGAIDSGFMPNINNALSPPPTFKIQVTSLNEICKAALARYNDNLLT